jgi:hypothetical protein
MDHVGKESGGDVSPPIGRRIELPISFRQGQGVSLRMQWVREFIAGVVARPGPGRPPYPRPPIIEVMEMAIQGGVDRTFREFRERVGGLLEWKGIPVPGDGLLKKLGRQIYNREKRKKT